jgi:hypothetical protein
MTVIQHVIKYLRQLGTRRKLEQEQRKKAQITYYPQNSKRRQKDKKR